MSRLISLFRSLTPQEVKKFGQFLQSPYYNATPKMRDLYKYLKKRHPECLFTDEDKQKLFTQIFSSEPYKLKKMNNLMASLSSILQDFLLLQHMKKGTITRHQSLFEIYQKRKLDKLSMQQLSILKNDFAAQTTASATSCFEGFKIHDNLYFHPLTQIIKWQKAKDYVYLKTALDQLRLFYAHMRMRYSLEIIFRGNEITDGFELTPDEQQTIKELITTHNVPLLKIYDLLYTLLKQPNAATYTALRNYVFQYIDDYNPLETNFLLTFLTNYQDARLRAGDNYAHKEALTLYKFGLKKNLYVNEAEHFRAGHFINISIFASELGDIEWLTVFIEQWKDCLKEEQRDNVTNLCYAYLHFAKHEYQDTIRLTSQVRREFPALALTCWTLEVRAYYMLQEKYDNWENILKNFSNYLWRQQKVSEERKEANRNFIAFLRLLYRAAYESKHSKSELFETLDNQQNIVCKRWLKEQVNKLK